MGNELLEEKLIQEVLFIHELIFDWLLPEMNAPEPVVLEEHSDDRLINFEVRLVDLYSAFDIESLCR